MTYFTDSPFERMMIQKPHVRREGKPPVPPKGNDRAAKNGACRSVVCYRDLIILPKKKEAEQCDL